MEIVFYCGYVFRPNRRPITIIHLEKLLADQAEIQENALLAHFWKLIYLSCCELFLINHNEPESKERIR